MTNIKILMEKDNIIGFVSSGHTGYAEHGKDILCSSISTLLLSTCLGIKKILRIPCEFDRDDKKGYLKIILKKNTEKAQVLFQTMVLSLKDIQKGNEQFLQIQF